MTTQSTDHSNEAALDSPGSQKLLVRNRVADYDRWRACFDDDLAPAAEYGLRLDALWQDTADPNNVFFLFDVRSVEEAKAFMARPESEAMGVRAGVLDGEFSFLHPAAPGNSPG